jgi:Domain of unknown function (DUF4194)
MDENNADAAQPTPRDQDLSTVLVSLLKGVIYRDENERLWSIMLRHQIRVREYVEVVGLELILDEAEGFAFLKSRPALEEDEALRMPRLVARRPLSFMVSLLLALLRKKLAEFDATGGETRLVLSREEILDLVAVFLPQNTNEARQLDQMDVHINKIIELGFLRRLRSTEIAGGAFEVRRILKAFVDAQWMSDFDARLESYRRHAIGDVEEKGGESGV